MRGSIGMLSKTSKSVGPLYQEQIELLTGSVMLAPVKPEIGTQ